MKRYLFTVFTVMALMLAIFGVVSMIGPPLLTDPDPDVLTRRGAIYAAIVGVLLLASDVALPVPSSVVMLANGALFGVIPGTLLSLAGSVAGVAIAFAIGRRGGRLLERIASPEEMRIADRVFHRWGTAAVILSRPFPILAETVVLFAGTSSMTWARVLLAAVAGLVPTCLAYAAAGSIAMTFNNMVVIFAATCGIAGAAWFIDRRVRRSAVDGSVDGADAASAGAAGAKTHAGS